jgi:hypothetical protein
LCNSIAVRCALGRPFALSYFELLQVTNWPLLIAIVGLANAILIVKILLSDYVKAFEMDSHCVQLSEMALTAFLATLAIQVLSPRDEQRHGGRPADRHRGRLA